MKSKYIAFAILIILFLLLGGVSLMFNTIFVCTKIAIIVGAAYIIYLVVKAVIDSKRK